jgi:hypothetical protein
MADIPNENNNITSLLKRVFIFLENEEWTLADEYCERVLEIEPENAMAYVGKLMAELCVKTQESLKDLEKPFDNNRNYQKAVCFGDEDLKTTLAGYVDHIVNRNEKARLEKERPVEIECTEEKKRVDRNRIIALIVIIPIILVLIVLNTHKHSYSEQIVDATCTSEGYVTYICSCGKTYTEKNAEPKGHDYKQKVTEPTCFKKGYTTYTCSCGDTYVANYVSPSHNFINYRCTKCSIADRTHAYEYLADWLKRHGTKNHAGLYAVSHYLDGTEFVFAVKGEAPSVGLAVGLKGPNGETVIVNISRTYFTYETQISGASATGTITNSTYVAYSSLSNFSYNGPSYLRSRYKEFTESIIGNAMTYLDYYIDTYIADVDIRDLGFSKFY